ncbi:MAG: PAS domain-containing protein, partial [Flavisolibacter sp.]
MTNHPSDSKQNNVNPLSKEEAFSLILNNTDESFLLINKDLQIVATSNYTKEQVDDLLGVKIIPGMSILHLVPESRRTSLTELYHDVFNGSDRMSFVEMNSGSSKKYFEISYKPARNDSGAIVAALVTSRNITKTKKAEDALREIEERWRYAIEGTNQGVWDWNMSTNETIYSNSYKKMYGFAEDELNNSIDEWETRVHPNDRERMQEAIQK